VIDEPAHGEFLGFASMLEQTPHQTGALEETECVEAARRGQAKNPRPLGRFRAEWRLPCSVRGPVDLCALLRRASRARGVM
jgi:hypothetical protein